MPRIKSQSPTGNVAIAHIREFALAKYLCFARGEGEEFGEISQEVRALFVEKGRDRLARARARRATAAFSLSPPSLLPQPLPPRKTQQALAAAAKKYAADPSKAAAALAAADEIEFAEFAAAFAQNPTAPEAEQAAEVGDEAKPDAVPALGFAARDATGDLFPLRFKRRPLGERDVLIAITHAGICHSDLHTVRGEWGDLNAKGAYPCVPGHEIVGYVVAVGPGASKFKIGDRAGVGTFVESCGDCTFCKRGDQPFCKAAVYTYAAKFASGAPSRGGYSSSITIDERYALRIPDGLPLERVAPLLCAGITTWTPLVTHGLDKPGKRVGVAGLGGLGHVAVKWIVALGGEAVVISRGTAKKADAEKLGAVAYLDSTDAEAMKAAEGTLDGVIDCISATHDVNALLRLTGPCGVLVLLGIPPSLPQISHVDLVMGQRTFAGSLVGGLEGCQRMLDFAGEKGVVADVEMVHASTEALREAYAVMEAGKVRYRYVIDVLASIVA